MTNNPQQHRIHLENSSSESVNLAGFLDDFVTIYDLPRELHDDMRLVLEEAFINVVSYAYDNDTSRGIDIELSCTGDGVIATIIDHGIAFNPLTDGEKQASTDDYSNGGMGIHIIRSLTDTQQYERIDQRNVFTVMKHYTR